MVRTSSKRSGFSERDFYLQEFRGRTLGIAAPAAAVPDPRPLRSVVRTLTRHGTRVVLVSDRPAVVEACGVGERLRLPHPRLEAAVWRALREGRSAGLVGGSQDPLERAVAEVATRLRLFKVVLLDPGGGITDRRDRVLSFVHRSAIPRILRRRSPPLAASRRALLREVARLLDADVPAVNLCAPDGLAEELFTYAGAGTLFTRDRYVQVRPLGVDDFDAAHDLLRRGVGEGYLAPRPPEEVDRVLACGFGAFVEGRHLAGIGALLEGPRRTAEIAALYTVTRFVGEGVGAHLVGFALARAADRRLRRVFACTTSERVGAFFERQGFEAVAPEELPAEKWRSYDPERRQRLRCYARAPRSGG